MALAASQAAGKRVAAHITLSVIADRAFSTTADRALAVIADRALAVIADLIGNLIFA